jgi:hypothetical protein
MCETPAGLLMTQRSELQILSRSFPVTAWVGALKAIGPWVTDMISMHGSDDRTAGRIGIRPRPTSSITGRRFQDDNNGDNNAAA